MPFDKVRKPLKTYHQLHAEAERNKQLNRDRVARSRLMKKDKSYLVKELVATRNRNTEIMSMHIRWLTKYFKVATKNRRKDTTIFYLSFGYFLLFYIMIMLYIGVF